MSAPQHDPPGWSGQPGYGQPYDASAVYGHPVPGPAGYGPPGSSAGYGPAGDATVGHGPAGHGPGGYGPAGYGPVGYAPAGYGPAGYGPAGYAPAGYGFPGYGPPAPVPPPMARPTTVTAGIALFVLAALVGLVSSVLVLVNREAYVDQALRDAGLTGTELQDGIGGAFLDSVSTATTTAAAVIALLGVALYATMAGFAWQGHNWARIVLWVLAGLGLFGLVGAIGAPVVVVTVLGVLQVLLLGAGAGALALGPSTTWYRVVGRRRSVGLPR